MPHPRSGGARTSFPDGAFSMQAGADGAAAAGRIIVTGGAGFIGSALIRQLIAETDSEVLNLDKLTYAGDPASVAEAADSPRYRLEVADICDAAAVKALFEG